MITSLEYFHYDGSQSHQALVDETNRHLKPILNTVLSAQKCIMFDDIHSKMKLNEFLSITNGLNIKPDTVYGESSFSPFMAKLYEVLKAKNWQIETEGNRDFLVEKNKTYHHEKKFLLRYENKESKQFSCPALVAASYLYRLGYFGDDVVQPLWGDVPISQNQDILTILPSRYMQVEANAQSIIQLIEPTFLPRIKWYFY